MKLMGEIKAEIEKLEAVDGNENYIAALHALLWVMGDYDESPFDYFNEN